MQNGSVPTCYLKQKQTLFNHWFKNKVTKHFFYAPGHDICKFRDWNLVLEIILI